MEGRNRGSVALSYARDDLQVIPGFGRVNPSSASFYCVGTYIGMPLWRKSRVSPGLPQGMRDML